MDFFRDFCRISSNDSSWNYSNIFSRKSSRDVSRIFFSGNAIVISPEGWGKGIIQELLWRFVQKLRKDSFRNLWSVSSCTYSGNFSRNSPRDSFSNFTRSFIADFSSYSFWIFCRGFFRDSFTEVPQLLSTVFCRQHLLAVRRLCFNLGLWELFDEKPLVTSLSNDLYDATLR